MRADFNTRYRFQVEVDQHGREVPPTYFDPEEQALISLFEETVRQEIEKVRIGTKTNNSELSMAELGSNQAYYSLLFRSMLREHGIPGRSLMVEPYDPFMTRSVRHMELNGFVQGTVFDRRSIGGEWKAWNGYKFEHGTVSVDGLMQEHGLPHLHVLHADIDGSELIMLEGAKRALTSASISHLFVLTHGSDLHSQCREMMLESHGERYELAVDEDNGSHGTDGLLYFREREARGGIRCREHQSGFPTRSGSS